MIFLYLFIGLFVGGFGIYLLLRPKLKLTAQKNLLIIQENNELEQKNHSLKDENNTLKTQHSILDEQNNQQKQLLNSTTLEYHSIKAAKEELNKSLQDLKATQEKAANDLYKQALNIAENSYEKEIDRISDDLFQQREQARNIYLQVQQEAVNDFQKEIKEKQQELNHLNKILNNEKTNVEIALAAAQRKLEMEQQQDYYRICLSDDDINEIKRLREVLPYLRDKTPLNKVIYKVYYERPLTDMIGRVIGSGVHTGIYKITNIDTQLCYVGQAVKVGR